MKLSHLFIAGAAAVSFSAIAADEAKESKSQQPQAQSSQSQGQKSEGQASQSASAGQSQSSERVKQVQQKLSEAGHQLEVDGIMGPKTQAALKEYQEKKGLQASGQLDQETLAELEIGEGGSASVGSSAEQPKPGKESGASQGASSGSESSEKKKE